jgi:DNA mismatch endonuclease (patch repair protein)
VADNLSPRERSRLMSRIRSGNTQPELAVRRFLFATGFRYRLHWRDLPGTPDLFLRKHRATIFVHGCFWHRHAGCSAATLPGGSASKRAYWRAKLEGNRRRDRAAVRRLLAGGMRVAVVWECVTRRLEREPDALKRLARWVRGRSRFIELP